MHAGKQNIHIITDLYQVIMCLKNNINYTTIWVHVREKL
jgi:hypothetical protein